MAINGKQGEVKKVDPYTVKFKFSDPYYMLPDVLAGSTDLGGQAWRGALGLGGDAPAHYLKQFHPKNRAPAHLGPEGQDPQFDRWGRKFFSQSERGPHPHPPGLPPLKTVPPHNTSPG